MAVESHRAVPDGDLDLVDARELAEECVGEARRRKAPPADAGVVELDGFRAEAEPRCDTSSAATAATALMAQIATAVRRCGR